MDRSTPSKCPFLPVGRDMVSIDSDWDAQVLEVFRRLVELFESVHMDRDTP